MAERDIQIQINAKNNTASGLDSAKSGVSSFKKGIESLQPAFKKMSIAGGVALAGITSFMSSAVKEATEANKSTASVNAVLASTKGIAGVTAEQVNLLADSLAKTSLFEDDAIKGAQAMLLTFTKVGKDVFPQATQAIVNMSAKMGTDLQSSTIQLGKALNDPIAGISALSRVGVQFTDTQKDMIQKMVDSGDLMGAQKVILAELETQFGGTAQAMAEADPFGMLKKSMGELKESIGTAFLPVLNSLVEKLKPVIEKVVEWIEANPELTGKIVMIAGAIAGLVTVVGLLGVALPVIATGFAILTGPIGIIIGLIALIAMNFNKIKADLISVAELWKKRWEDIKNFTKGVVEAIIKFFQPLVDIVNGIVAGIERAVSFVGEKLGIGGKKSKKVNDAVITPQGDVIETHPKDYLIATKNPFAMGSGNGGGPNITINYPMLLDNNSVQLLSQKIGNALRMELLI